MLPYIVRRLLLGIPLLFAVITLVFILLEFAPGDATSRFITPEMKPIVREMLIKKWGLDQPAHVRYFKMMGNMIRFDFGRSIDSERPVTDLILERLPNTLVLAIVTLTMVFGVGCVVGTIQAVRQYSVLDNVLAVTSLFLLSMPEFWLALMLMLIFSLLLGWLPSSGMVDPVLHDYMSPTAKLLDRAKHLILPGGALGIAYAGGIARYMRSSLLEVVRQDYVRTARAKGLPESRVILQHALRNALIPIVTLLGLSLPALFSGSVVVEYIFAWPGMGRLIVDSIFIRDTPVVIGCFFFFAVLVVIGNLVADVLYAVVDPRIKYA